MEPPSTSPARVLGIVTPQSPGTDGGNGITARRWAALLRALGHETFVETAWSGRACDGLVALHAGKSAASVARFREERPRAPIVVLLTGTDVYGELERDAEALRALASADRIAVLQPRAILALPEALRAKARVVRQSARPPRGAGSAAATAGGAGGNGTFDVSVVGHLREVKDPLRAARAARALPADSRLRVLHAGDALTTELRERAEREQRENPRYRWLGPLPHEDALVLIARSRLHVLTSRSEGGANVVSEAIACGVPVISSRIDGSIGILGEAYPGYFEPGDEAGLARLLRRVEEDEGFRGALAEWCARLRPLVAPERERDALAALLAELFEEPGATPRLRALGGEDELPFTRIAASVRSGLAAQPKRIECRWLYDEEGSRLFEEICRLPEYGVWRAEDAILRAHAAEIVARLPAGAALVELGSGDASKTRRLLAALLARERRVDYAMIDISPSALESSARALLADEPRLRVTTLCGEYDEGVARLAALAPAPRLVAWLGSNVGNFGREAAAAFLRRVRARLDPRDRFLLGVDLRKPAAELERAYDDAAGVTARFDRNLLVRINRELRGDLDVAAFDHRATYDEVQGRVEMWLVSRRAQRARIELLDLDLSFAAGEAIHTEDSFKYSLGEIDALARAAGMRIDGRWLDPAASFADLLLAPADGE